MADSGFTPLALGEWRPDRPAYMSDDLTQADNCLPVTGGYAPFADHVPVSGATLASAAKGMFVTVLPDGSPAIYAATSGKIYRVTTSGLVLAYDASPASATRWWFAQVGGKVCAGCDGIAPVGGEVGSSFSVLGGSPPYAAVGAVVNRDYLALGNLKNEPADGTVPNRVRWSGILNPDTWGTDIGTGADFEDMHDEGGPVVQITGRSVGLVFQRKGITRMAYTGNAATVFSFTTLELGRGAVSAGGVCDAGQYVFFRADDGFFVHDGTQSVPIGTDKVDGWFKDNADPSKIDLMRSGFDPVNRCVLWAFAENGQTTNSAMLCYSIPQRRFTLVRKAMEDLYSAATLPATLESMPTPDTDPIPWDDGSRAGKLPILSGIDSSHAYGTFSGSALAATWSTGDFHSAPGQRAFVAGVRPIIDAATAKVAVGSRAQSTKDALAWRAATGLGVDGVCPQRADARYHRFQLTTDAGDTWTRAAALEIDAQDGGMR